LGLPQGISFLKQNIEYCKSIKKAFFLIIGDGTEYVNVKQWIERENLKNVLLIKELPKSHYDDILKVVHVGLIFLNPLFTIPNFPSRVLSYMQNKLPVICATDMTTDIGKIVSSNNFGYMCFTSDSESFFDYVLRLLNKELRTQMGENSFNYLRNHYNIDVSYNKIINKLN
jgi:glycosyltransferase involved in cell wall biosynthesis